MNKDCYEIIVLQHRFTEATICVNKPEYIAGAKNKYRNWRMKGQGKFIAPPPLVVRWGQINNVPADTPQ